MIEIAKFKGKEKNKPKWMIGRLSIWDGVMWKRDNVKKEFRRQVRIIFKLHKQEFTYFNFSGS